MKRTLSDWKIHTVAFKKGAERLLLRLGYNIKGRHKNFLFDHNSLVLFPKEKHHIYIILQSCHHNLYIHLILDHHQIHTQMSSFHNRAEHNNYSRHPLVHHTKNDIYHYHMCILYNPP